MLQRWAVPGISWQKIQGPELAWAMPGWSLAKSDHIMLPHTDGQLSKAKSFRAASQMQAYMCRTSQDTRCQKCCGRSNMSAPVKNKHISFSILAF